MSTTSNKTSRKTTKTRNTNTPSTKGKSTGSKTTKRKEYPEEGVARKTTNNLRKSRTSKEAKVKLDKNKVTLIAILAVIGVGVLFNMIFLKHTEDKSHSKITVTSDVTQSNPYGELDISEETKKTLKDSNYDNIILPEDLRKKLVKREDITVYFFSPTCPYCEIATPIIVSLAKKLGVELYLFNVLEFTEERVGYEIISTPTVIRFEKGKEKDRLIGAQSEIMYQNWLIHILNK